MFPLLRLRWQTEVSFSNRGMRIAGGDLGRTKLTGSRAHD
jgi:hypothetical protein